MTKLCGEKLITIESIWWQMPYHTLLKAICDTYLVPKSRWRFCFRSWWVAERWNGIVYIRCGCQQSTDEFLPRSIVSLKSIVCQCISAPIFIFLFSILDKAIAYFQALLQSTWPVTIWSRDWTRSYRLWRWRLRRMSACWICAPPPVAKRPISPLSWRILAFSLLTILM